MPFIAVCLSIIDSYMAFFGWRDPLIILLIWNVILLWGYFGMRRWWPQLAYRTLILTIRTYAVPC